MGFGSSDKGSSLTRLSNKFSRGDTHIVDVSVRPAELVQDCKEVFDLFKDYEVTAPLLVRTDEDPGSLCVGEISPGSCITVLKIGGRSDQRLKVTNAQGTLSGWISPVSDKGELALQKKKASWGTPCIRSNSLTSNHSNSSRTSVTSRASKAASAVSSSVSKLLQRTDPELTLIRHPQLGDLLETVGKVIVREGEPTDSPIVQTLKRGSQVRILQIGWSSANRVKVSVEGSTGWVSVLDKNQHEPLLARRVGDL